ncbi:hypothetical protein [Pseudalkalibacillus salsuginis]|uniref:hypothetical protein n=1 Tax=Pseudalkalibacillus salsuginis TaxID=2910972 RepID=UPI001F36CC28|nr:hypothetical protein [Pseudalkalibacillus salsuginis]MCF6409756.1 hypothetical protein [Pseudalkalibacillus salsuginis]
MGKYATSWVYQERIIIMKRFYILGLFLVSIILTPIVVWHLDSAKNLKVAIFDKTVPTETYREHQGVTWVLNHLNYVTKENESYNANEDYYGFFPNEKKEDYTTRPLPADLSEYDVIYLADTYGVYEEDLPWFKKKREGSRSEQIHGGLEEKEWHSIVARLNENEKSLFIAEFNTFASPTSEAVRNSVTDYLEVDWSGWIGRYFNELDPVKNREIPQWILDEFQETWDYSGEGFILVNDIDYEVVVLEKNTHVKGSGINLTFTEEGQGQFNLKKSPDYQYWFDIVTPKNGSKVLANYDWELTNRGKQVLNDHQIPLEFAAVLTKENGASSNYYFAGDFNDIEKVPSFYQMKGLDHVYKIAQKYSDDAFYWSTYVPMVEAILERFESRSTPSVSKAEELQYTSRIENDSFEILKDDKWVPFPIKGVNMGMGKPGHFPGEAAITEEEYYDWLVQIGEMNANSIRVYTLHPPGFYKALKRYNEKHEEKIYIFHGVWIDEKNLEETLDAYKPENLEEFQDEIRKIVDVVHGNKIVEVERGHASGVYQADISQYVIGWILGIEWYPDMVKNTNEVHATMEDYHGQYFQTKDAQPFEIWLAQQMDTLVKYEVDHYNWIRPISFTNWVTTDILEHPSEPDENEDLVSVDPNVIYTKGNMDLTDQFASYHVYPYYPDFFNYEESYQNYVDHRGEKNSYAAYLSDLHNAHRLPILVAEFGVPSSRGLTHVNPFGWNQGFLSEKEQGVIIRHLYEDIMAEQLLGGLIFTWQDEWFKRTWNTKDYDNPERRPYWSNAQTNEQQFGLLSFDRHKIKVDGATDDWNEKALYAKMDEHLKALYVDHDERYLYLRIDYDKEREGYPKILLDVIPDQGNHFIVGLEQTKFSNGVDFLINLIEKESSILVDAYYDAFTYHYGHQLELIQPQPPLPEKNSGIFSKLRYALNKELSITIQNRVIPFQSYETGKLKIGNGNPDSADYDSLADYHVNEDGLIELRIPWLLLHAKDPSQKEFTGNLYSDGLEASTKIEQINIGVLFFDEDQQVIDSFPSIKNDVLVEMNGYKWQNWNSPQYEERLKQSYFIVKDLFGND